MFSPTRHCGTPPPIVAGPEAAVTVATVVNGPSGAVVSVVPGSAASGPPSTSKLIGPGALAARTATTPAAPANATTIPTSTTFLCRRTFIGTRRRCVTRTPSWCSSATGLNSSPRKH